MQRADARLELSAKQERALKDVARTLRQRRIPFQITGGLAAILYGARRPLYDIDIDVYQKDIPKVRELFRSKIREDLHRFQDKNFDLWLLTLDIDGVPVDISQAEECYLGDGRSEKVRADANLSGARPMRLDNMSVPVVNKDDLITYKKLLARDTDLLDIEQIA